MPIEFDPQVRGDNGLGGVSMPWCWRCLRKRSTPRVALESSVVGQEPGAAGKLADGVLEAGQSIVLHLGPIEGDVGKVFDIHLEAGEGDISGFDGAEVVFAVVAALGRPSQLVGKNDALGRPIIPR